MEKVSSIYVRVEPELKEEAENILGKLGMPISKAVSIFLRQVVLQQGIPFEIKLPQAKLLSFQYLSQHEVDFELKKGLNSIKRNDVYSSSFVEEELRKDFNI